MTAPEKSFTIQVGAFGDEANAKQYAAELAGMRYSPHIFSGRNSRGRLLYCVRIGAYPTWAAAEKAAAEFQKKRDVKAFVRPSVVL